MWYSAFQAKGLQLKELPKFDGFVVKTIQSKTQRKIKTINGKKYLTNKEYSFILTPIKAGNIKIPKVKGEMYLTSGRGFFAQTEVRAVSSSGSTLKVKPLPTPPSGATGTILVCNYKLEASTDKSTLEVNDAVTIRIKVSGKGNLNKLNDVNVKLPSAFEALPSTIKDNVKTDYNGIGGSKTFEFVGIPRQPGNFKIAPIEIWCFNPKTGKYYSLKSEELQVKVTGNGTNDINPYVSSGGSDVELQGSDIRYLNEIEKLSSEDSSDFTSSGLQYVLLILGLGAFGAGSFLFKERKFSNSDVKSNKKAKANKVAQKYLKDAQKELNGDKNKFYELVDEAINNYLLGKLMIDQSQLKKEIIKEELTQQGVDSELIENTLNVSSDCKMARFSPMVLPPNEMFSQAETVINELENQLK